MDFNPSDFLLPAASPGCDSPPLGSSPSEALPEAAPRTQGLATAQAPCGKFASLPWEQPEGTAAFPEGSPERGPSPASTASASCERRSQSRRYASAAGAAAPWPLGDSECSEACSRRSSDAAGSEEPVGAAAPGVEPSEGGAGECSGSGSLAGTPSPQPGAAAGASIDRLPAGTSIDRLPEPACITPPACQLSGGSSAVDAGSASAGCSRVLTPSGLSPAQQVEVLQARLEAEAEARAAAHRHLAEQRAEAERHRQALGERYEARLAALRRELQEAAEAGAGAELSRSILVGGEATQRSCCLARWGWVPQSLQTAAEI